MRPALLSYLLVALVAFFVTLVMIPLFVRLGKKFKVTSSADSYREDAQSATPLMGGLAMYCGFVVAFVAARLSGAFDTVFTGAEEPFLLFFPSEPIAIIAAVTLVCFVGAVDDVIDISAPAKTAGISLAGIFLVFGGINIIWFRIPFLDVFVVDYDWTFLLTIIWLLGLSNAINFIDGLDGLAAGIVGIGALTFLLYGFRLGQVGLIEPSNIGPLIAALALGVCAGFLPWNFFPAKIFMGDSGSLLLGCLMTASTVAVGGRTPDPFSGQTFFFYAPLVIPIVILGVPIIDTAFAIIRRASSGQGIATADKDHLHHRLMRLGHGHRRSVAILWGWTALLSAFVLYPTYNEGEGDAIVPLGVAILGGFLYLGLLFFTLRRGPHQVKLDTGIREAEPLTETAPDEGLQS